jgi:Ulp1 family protease
VKLGRGIAKSDVVAVPFGSLPDDFGITPMTAKNRHRKREAKEVVAAPLLEVTVGEVARASNVTSEEVKVPVSLLATKQETSKRIRNVADDHSNNTKKKAKARPVEAKGNDTKKKAKAKRVEGKETDVFPLDDDKDQPKEKTKKKAINVAELGDDGPTTNADLLLFPFVSGRNIETETSSLKLCHFLNHWVDENYDALGEKEVIKRQRTLSSGRNQMVSITEHDMKTLEPGKFLNDTIIDFWMCWLMRKELPKESAVHIFSTHFYTKLLNEGYESVAHWTKNRGINVLEKKLVLIPINKQSHWSLCAVINAGYIDYGGVSITLNGVTPVILLLDSLRLHSVSEVSDNIRMWLNAEYSRVRKKEGSTVFNGFTIRSAYLKGKTIDLFLCQMMYCHCV